MRVISKATDGLTVSLTHDELGIINQALNEVLNGLWLPEFETRMGFSTAEVSQLLEKVHDELPHGDAGDGPES